MFEVFDFVGVVGDSQGRKTLFQPSCAAPRSPEVRFGTRPGSRRRSVPSTTMLKSGSPGAGLAATCAPASAGNNTRAIRAIRSAEHAAASSLRACLRYAGVSPPSDHRHWRVRCNGNDGPTARGASLTQSSSHSETASRPVPALGRRSLPRAPAAADYRKAIGLPCRQCRGDRRYDQRSAARFDGTLVPDTKIVILAIGINDGLRGVPVATVERNITAMIERAQAAEHPGAAVRDGSAAGRGRPQLHDRVSPGVHTPRRPISTCRSCPFFLLAHRREPESESRRPLPSERRRPPGHRRHDLALFAGLCYSLLPQEEIYEASPSYRLPRAHLRRSCSLVSRSVTDRQPAPQNQQPGAAAAAAAAARAGNLIMLPDDATQPTATTACSARRTRPASTSRATVFAEQQHQPPALSHDGPLGHRHQRHVVGRNGQSVPAEGNGSDAGRQRDVSPGVLHSLRRQPGRRRDHRPDHGLRPGDDGSGGRG